MGQTLWYAYGGRVTGPFFETKAEAAEACSDGEKPRPVDSDVVDRDDSDDDVPLDEMGHAELKAEAERRGVADDIDLRSKESIRDALAE